MKSALQIEEYIQEQVQYSKKYYNRKMLQTKRKFFEYLNNGKTTEEFKKELYKIWGDIDHKFMDEKLKDLDKMVKNKDFKDFEKYVGKDLAKEVELTFEKRAIQEIKEQDIYKLNPESEFIKTENNYIRDKERLYNNSLNSLTGEVDKQEYLGNLVTKYDKTEATIPYFNKDGSLKCYNTIATYNAMLYNVNLTKTAWNTTYIDSQILNNDKWIIYPHMYSCPACSYHQGKVYTEKERENAIYDGVGHPNCKCVWYLYWSREQLDFDRYDSQEWTEAYHTRQKLQSLNLKRYRLKNDRAIQKYLGNEEKADELLKKISKLNKEIKELKGLLPTDPEKVMQSLSTRQ